MTLFQKIKSCIVGALLVAAAVILILVPAESYLMIPIFVGITLLVYGIRFLWYYIRMARHMVGGKSFLYQGIIVMDVALFTVSISTMNNNVIVLMYLLGIYAFSGAIDILRALEAKQNGSSEWRLKLYRGIVSLVFVIVLFIIGFILKMTDIFVYGYSISLIYTAIMHFVAAFKKTAVVYIQ